MPDAEKTFFEAGRMGLFKIIGRKCLRMAGGDDFIDPALECLVNQIMDLKSICISTISFSK